jgi:long-chain acyl-CoA synthetase
VEQFSKVLASLGLGKGDRFGLLLPNCPQYVIGYYAALRLGAVVVGNNPLYTSRELTHQLTDAGIEVLLTLDVLYPKVGEVREATGLRQVIVSKVTDFMPFPVNRLAPIRMKKEARHTGEPWPPVPAGAAVLWWKDLMRATFPDLPKAEVHGDDLAGLIYTGGTTGLSKGAMLTHGNLLSNVIQGRAWFPDLVEGRESVMCVLPFFHSFGMTVCMNIGIKLAGKLILEVRFDLENALQAVQRERATMFPGVPRLYIAINESPHTPKYDLTSIKACFSGAAPLPTAVQEKFEQLTGGRIVEGYGLTETSPITHANPVSGIRRPGAIGLPIPDTDCRIVDLNDWTKAVGDDEPGELIIAGPQVMQGYFNKPEETAAVIQTDAAGQRWLLTGDIATVDDDGFFHIVDRKKDMIIVSGFNVYPTDIEQILYRHPKVEKVCVAGVPDETTGEAVKAYIVLRKGEAATAEEFREWLKNPDFGLTGYKVPKLYEFRDSLPETIVGKVLRRVLADEEAQKAGAAGG